MATSSADISSEFLSWGVLGLALTLWSRRCIPSRNILRVESMPNHLIWAASLCIASSRLMSLYYSVTPPLVGGHCARERMLTDQPLVTASTELALHQIRSGDSLPSWEGSDATRRGSRWARTAAVVGLGIWCHLLLRSEDSYLEWMVFAMLRTASFVFLEALKERGDISPNEERLGVEGIVVRAISIIVAVMIFVPHSFAWSMAWQVLLSIVELGMTYYMVRWTVLLIPVLMI